MSKAPKFTPEKELQTSAIFAGDVQKGRRREAWEVFMKKLNIQAPMTYSVSYSRLLLRVKEC